MKNNRIAVIVGVLVVAAVIGFVALRGGYPPKSGTEGTIGAADRYTSEQISNADVNLQGPEAQAFIQSDVFHKLATDKLFRESLKDGSLRNLMDNAAIVDLLGNKEASDLLVKNGDFASIAKNLEQGRYNTEQAACILDAGRWLGAEKPGRFFDYMKDAAFKDALMKADVNAVNKIDPMILKDAGIQKALDLGVFKDGSVFKTLESYRGFLTDLAQVSGLDMGNVAKAATDQLCVDALSKDGIRQIIETGFITDALRMDTNNFKFEQLFTTDEGIKYLNDALATIPVE